MKKKKHGDINAFKALTFSNAYWASLSHVNTKNDISTNWASMLLKELQDKQKK